MLLLLLLPAVTIASIAALVVSGMPPAVRCRVVSASFVLSRKAFSKADSSSKPALDEMTERLLLLPDDRRFIVVLSCFLFSSILDDA